MHNNIEIDRANIARLDRKIERLRIHLPKKHHYRGYDARKGLENTINRRAMLLRRIEETAK